MPKDCEESTPAEEPTAWAAHPAAEKCASHGTAPAPVRARPELAVARGRTTTQVGASRCWPSTRPRPLTTWPLAGQSRGSDAADVQRTVDVGTGVLMSYDRRAARWIEEYA